MAVIILEYGYDFWLCKNMYISCYFYWKKYVTQKLIRWLKNLFCDLCIAISIHVLQFRILCNFLCFFSFFFWKYFLFFISFYIKCIHTKKITYQYKVKYDHLLQTHLSFCSIWFSILCCCSWIHEAVDRWHLLGRWTWRRMVLLEEFECADRHSCLSWIYTFYRCAFSVATSHWG